MRAGRKFILSVLGICLGLAIAELSVRLLGFQPYGVNKVDVKFEPSNFAQPDSLLGYSAKIGAFTSILKESLHSTAIHWPDQSRATRHNQTDSLFMDKPRTHLYGCSFMYGQYLDDTMHIGWKMQQQLPIFDVRNYAFGGYGTIQPLLQLQQHLQQGLRPKWVVLGYASFWDERNVMPRSRLKILSSYENQKESMIKVQWPSVILEEPASFSVEKSPFIYEPSLLVEQSALANLAENMLFQIERDLKAERVTSELIVDSIQKLSAAYDFELLIVGMKKDRATAEFLKHCSNQGIRTIDVAVDLLGAEYTLHPLDRHPNSKAHSIFADKVAAYINQAE